MDFLNLRFATVWAGTGDKLTPGEFIDFGGHFS